MNEWLVLLIGIVLGSIVGWTIRGNLTLVHTQFLAYVRQIEEHMENRSASEHSVDNFKQWWYSNSPFFDIRTNELVAKFFQSIALATLLQPSPDNVFTIPAVKEAFYKVKNVIKIIADQRPIERKEQATPDILTRRLLLAQIPTWFLASFLFLEMSGTIRWIWVIFALALTAVLFIVVVAWGKFPDRVVKWVVAVMELPYWLVSMFLFMISLGSGIVAMAVAPVSEPAVLTYLIAGLLLATFMTYQFVILSRQQKWLPIVHNRSKQA